MIKEILTLEEYRLRVPVDHPRLQGIDISAPEIRSLPLVI
jgi:hypothetical protein